MKSLLCPNCKNQLTRLDEKQFKCENNHNFDLAKEGYLNLLIANKKKSKSPGDNKEMVNARREFLNLGYYTPLVHAIQRNITKLDMEEHFDILDAGCGEGYYCNAIFPDFKGDILGFDISKEAIKKAAKKYKDNFYFVGNVFDIPVKESAIDFIISVFSPFSVTEFKRLLKSNGKIIIVSSGSNHLKELAELVYDNFKEHPFTVADKVADDFNIINKESIRFKMNIKSNQDLISLLKMTPYFWSTRTENLEKIKAFQTLEVTCDFRITVLEKKME